jgi:hypothetical protein
LIRHPSTTTSCVAPANPSASEKAIVHASHWPGSPMAMPASAAMIAICETTIQPRLRPRSRLKTGAS